MDQRSLQLTRLGIGLAQGIVLYIVTKTTAGANPYTTAALMAAGFFVPLIVISGLGNLRPRVLLTWAVFATAMCVSLAVYDIYRSPVPQRIGWLNNAPSFWLWIGLAALVFVIDSLVVAADADRRWIGRYASLFGASWKLGLQIHLAVLFIAILAGVLALGAALFSLIGITAIARTIVEPLFWIPVTGMAVAYALHVTDARAGIVRGTQTLVLTLLSWLLPVMTILVIGFILTLPHTGIDALWNTRRATLILMSAAGMLVFLINATYQNGDDEKAGVLQYFRILAAVSIVPLAGLAGYALSLRVSQYGWTPDRVITAALVLMAACYGIGYTGAAALTGLSMRGIEPVNIGAAFVLLAIVAALMSPLADPSRISVDNQMARLRDGKVSADKFDYSFLRNRAGRYGRAALDEMANQTYGPVAAENAERARSSAPGRSRPAVPPSPDQLLANITVVTPPGGAFPLSLLQQDWSKQPRFFALPRCLTRTEKCNAVLMDLDGDGKDEVLLFLAPGGGGHLFKEYDTGWRLEGTLTNGYCVNVREAIARGDVVAAEPRFKDIQAGGQRLTVTEPCAPIANATRR